MNKWIIERILIQPHHSGREMMLKMQGVDLVNQRSIKVQERDPSMTKK